MSHHTLHESLVLDVLRSADSLTMEQMIEQLPQVSWSELFHTVDALSRRGAIILRRRGFEYELRSCVGHLEEQTI